MRQTQERAGLYGPLNTHKKRPNPHSTPQKISVQYLNSTSSKLTSRQHHPHHADYFRESFFFVYYRQEKKDKMDNAKGHPRDSTSREQPLRLSRSQKSK